MIARVLTVALLAGLVPGVAFSQVPCEPGQTFEYGTGDATHRSEIVGLRSFRGKELCLARTTMATAEGTMTSEYYFNEDASEVWMVVVGPDGERHEMHMTQAADAAQRDEADSWCETGTTWSMTGMAAPGTPSEMTGKVEGLTQFKGGTYCRAVWEMTQGGQKMSYTYYFNADGDDVWVVLEMPGGIRQEMHISDPNR